MWLLRMLENIVDKHHISMNRTVITSSLQSVITYSPNFCIAAMQFLFDPDEAGMQNEFTAAERSSGDFVNNFATVDDTVQCVMCASAAALCGQTDVVLYNEQ